MMLGRKVRIEKKLTRKSVWKKLDKDERGLTTYPRQELFKTWERRDLPKPLEGIIVGIRTLQNGYTEWLGEDAGNGWKCLETVTAYLVSTHLRKEVVRVHKDDVIFLNEEKAEHEFDWPAALDALKARRKELAGILHDPTFDGNQDILEDFQRNIDTIDCLLIMIQGGIVAH